MFGIAKQSITGNLNKAKGMGMEFGNLQILILILSKASMLRTIKMDMAYTHGRMELFTKGHSRTI